jgi:hypothetical protein
MLENYLQFLLKKAEKMSGDEFIENFYYANRKKYELMNNLKITNEMAEVLNIQKNDLAQKYKDRDILNHYKYLEGGLFRPYTISKPLMQKTEKYIKNYLLTLIILK